MSSTTPSSNQGFRSTTKGLSDSASSSPYTPLVAPSADLHDLRLESPFSHGNKDASLGSSAIGGAQFDRDRNKTKLDAINKDKPFPYNLPSYSSGSLTDVPIEQIRQCMLPEDLFDLGPSPSLDSSEKVLAYAKQRFFRAGMENTWSVLEPIIEELANTPAVRRLNGVGQMTFGLSERGQYCDHSRLLHSVDAMLLASYYSLHLLRSEEGQVVMRPSDVVHFALAGFLHDLGHTPFSHAAEKYLARFGQEFVDRLGIGGNKFDHENNTQLLIIESPIAEILDRHGVSSGEILDILNPDHDFHTIQDFADRVSYVLRDLSKVEGISETIRDEALRASVDMYRALRIDPTFIRVAFCPEVGPSVIATVQNVRRLLFQEASVSPEALVVNRVLSAALEDFFDRVDPVDFLYMTDAEVLEQFSPEYRSLLCRKGTVSQQQGQRVEGIESRLTRVTGYRMEDLIPGTEAEILGHSSHAIFEEHWRDRFEAELLPRLARMGYGEEYCTGLLSQIVIVPGNEEVEKVISYHLLGRSEEKEHVSVIDPKNRFLAVFLPADSYPSEVVELVSSVVHASFLKHGLIGLDAKSCASSIFGPTEQGVYRLNTAV